MTPGHPNPDTPALRTLLAAIAAKLDIPQAAHPGDGDLERVALRAAAHDVQLAIRCLLDGPLDYVAIQAHGQMLNRRTVTVSYQTTGHAA